MGRPGGRRCAGRWRPRRAPVTYTVLEGEHEGWYWQHYLPEYLNFYARALHAPARTPQGAPAVGYRPLGPRLDSAAGGAGPAGGPGAD